MRLRPLFALILLSGLAAAQTSELRLPITLAADSTDYDGKSSMMMFQGLRLSQGTTNIEADEGRATKIDFEDSIWHFNGNVVIDVEAGHIESDSAELQFKDTQLRLAIFEGQPATFELRRPGSEEITYAEAGRLKYDLDTGTVEFSDEAVITEGGNRIASNYLLYNITEQRISAQSSGEGDEKVKITVIPETIEEQVPSEDELP
ncbi:MAG: LptA/OstA family protein [Woeseiaceae bacterium]|nr:LptA/OstA family protein [Woeseiaceae bacterium]